jgi:hypothetical protein
MGWIGLDWAVHCHVDVIDLELRWRLVGRTGRLGLVPLYFYGALLLFVSQANGQA